MNNSEAGIIKSFEQIEDKRVAKKVLHPLIDIIAIVICGVVAGYDEWEKIAMFANAKSNWLKKILKLPNGIPSHDTMERVFSWIDPEQFHYCFLDWVNSTFEVSKGQVIAIDGKTLRGSYDSASNKAAIHMVSAWASANGIVVGQVKTDSKSNEITAIPELLKILGISGCIVTIDAMGCQKEIAEEIVDREADYVLALKENHPILYKDVTLFLDNALEEKFKDVEYSYMKTVDKGHGRIETRRYWITSQIDWLWQKKEWKSLKSIGMVESTREIKGKKSVERRYYITSIEPNAKLFEKAIRGHWGIENNLHWMLDVVFNEDESRIRKDNAPENMAVVRHLALNLLKQDTSVKLSMSKKRVKAGLDEEYLERVLFGK